jgi:peptide/nickel transport system substrate-binding protein
VEVKTMRFLKMGLLMMMAVACGGGSSTTAPAGSILASVISDPKSFNPVTARETSTTDVLGLVFEGLVSVNGRTYEVEPALAERWSVSEDGRSWTFHLRRDVVWTDGVPLTSRDVLFSFNDLIFNPKVAAGMRDLLQIDGRPFEVTASDTWTVIIRTPRPFAPFLRTIGASILPAHRFSPETDFNQALGINTPLNEIVGTGPYRITEFTPGQRVVLEANELWWKKGADGAALPRTKRIVLNVVPDLDAEIEWFKAGRTDFVGVRGHDWPLLARAAQGYTMRNLGPRFSSTFIMFNQNLAAAIPEAKQGWFRDRAFREACAWAIDRRAIVDGIYNGLAYEQHSPIPEANTLFYDTGLFRYGYDLARSAEILRVAGYRREGEGPLLDAKGNPVAFEILTNAGNNERVRSATVVAEGLRHLGMDVRVQTMDFNALVGRLDNELDWEACVLGLTSGLDPHNGSNVWRVEGDLHMFNQKPRRAADDTSDRVRRRQIEAERRWRAGIRPWEREIEAKINRAAEELDPVRRRVLYNELQGIVSRELPFIYTASPAALYATRDRIVGVDPSPLGSTVISAVLHNVEELIAP